MQLRQSCVHSDEIGGAFSSAHIRQGCVPEYTSLDHVHDEEPTADNAVVQTNAVHVGHWESGRAKGAKHPRFAVDGMSPFGQDTGRLAAQYIGLGRGHQLVGRVGLTSAKFKHLQRSGKAGHMLCHPTHQRTFVKGEASTHRHHTRIVGARTHPAFSAFQSRLIFLARLHL